MIIFLPDPESKAKRRHGHKSMKKLIDACRFLSRPVLKAFNLSRADDILVQAIPMISDFFTEEIRLQV